MRTTMALVAALMLVIFGGCDEGGGGGGGGGASPPSCDVTLNPYAPTTVVWWIDANGVVQYLNHDDSKTVKEFFQDHRTLTVVWNCADYQDDDGIVYDNVLVSFIFEAWAGLDPSWKLENKRFEHGICDPSCP